MMDLGDMLMINHSQNDIYSTYIECPDQANTRRQRIIGQWLPGTDGREQGVTAMSHISLSSNEQLKLPDSLCTGRITLWCFKRQIL